MASWNLLSVHRPPLVHISSLFGSSRFRVGGTCGFDGLALVGDGGGFIDDGTAMMSWQVDGKGEVTMDGQIGRGSKGVCPPRRFYWGLSIPTAGGGEAARVMIRAAILTFLVKNMLATVIKAI
ncbi:unnamed protein product [Ilex paraguariensis]|uniref:Uncharacterized protein n=1 Tax=Ilex paraguariensis TaxID=185542 RepID=A0ABC8RG10_9AQUA